MDRRCQHRRARQSRLATDGVEFHGGHARKGPGPTSAGRTQDALVDPVEYSEPNVVVRPALVRGHGTPIAADGVTPAIPRSVSEASGRSGHSGRSAGSGRSGTVRTFGILGFVILGSAPPSRSISRGPSVATRPGLGKGRGAQVDCAPEPPWQRRRHDGRPDIGKPWQRPTVGPRHRRRRPNPRRAAYTAKIRISRRPRDPREPLGRFAAPLHGIAPPVVRTALGRILV